ncbi:hypothetical protein OG523_02280 [Streptomyces virginiae]|uniref:hypothetical protein n=1 Tax=Streptomyces virginiae TaxID=1961 RepID=UPI002E35ECAB|nr:hypothetical protein [Streptomyces virginiae]
MSQATTAMCSFSAIRTGAKAGLESMSSSPVGVRYRVGPYRRIMMGKSLGILSHLTAISPLMRRRSRRPGWRPVSIVVLP